MDEVWYKFDRCCKALQEEVGRLPVYGVGHSQGALLHMLLCSRYSVKVRKTTCTYVEDMLQHDLAVWAVSQQLMHIAWQS